MRVLLAIFAMLLLVPSTAISKPSRIVSIDRGADEYLMLLAERKNIAALTWLVGKPDVSNVLEQAKGIPVTRGSIEEILLLKPDLVVGNHLSNAAKIQMLQKLQIPCFILDTPTTFDEVRQQTLKLARVLDEELRAEEVLRQMDERLSRVRPLQGRRRGMIFCWAGGYTSGKDSMVNAIIQAAGAENLGAQITGPALMRGSPRISLETLILSKPDILVFSNFRQDAPTVGRQILTHPALRQEKILRNSYVVPARIINSTSPMAVEAVEMLNEILEGRAPTALARP